MMFRILLCVVIIIPWSLQAEIYQCKSDDGKTIYKDQPCAASESLKKIITPEKIDKNITILQPRTVDNRPLGENLIRNHDFESKLQEWRIPLGALWALDGGYKKSGALIIQARHPADDNNIHETTVKQCVTLNQATKYEFAAKFKSEKPPSYSYANRANIIWYRSLDCTIGAQFGTYLEPAQFKRGWTNLSTTVKPALNSRAASIEIVQNGRFSNNSKAYWDNLTLHASEIFESTSDINPELSLQDTLPLNTNHLKNATFDHDVTEWRQSWKTEWTGIEGNSKKGATKVTVFSKKNSIGRMAIAQCVNIGNNRFFEFGGSFKHNQASARKVGGRLRVAWFGNRNCSGSLQSGEWVDIKPEQGWQHLKLSNISSPDNAMSAQVSAVQTILEKGKFYGYWDDMYFNAVAE